MRVRACVSASALIAQPLLLRQAMLDFIADFSNWDNSSTSEYLEAARSITYAAHWALGLPNVTGNSNSISASALTKQVAEWTKLSRAHPRPMVADPFAGGGSIPLEALRIGADSFASDYNPVPVLLNRVILEYIPKHGARLADELRKAGEWIKAETAAQMAELYPSEGSSRSPVAYLWARTIACEGPACGAEVPLIRSLLLSKKAEGAVALQLRPKPQQKQIDIQLIKKTRQGWIECGDVNVRIDSPSLDGTVKRGSATCPLCNYTTPVARVRAQLKAQNGGADSSRLMCVVVSDGGEKRYRLATHRDIEAVKAVAVRFRREDILPPVELPLMSGVFNAPIYGITRWDLLFSIRQLASAELLSRSLKEVGKTIDDPELAKAVKVLLSLAINKYLDFRSTLCGWISMGEKIGHTFGRQALGMIFDWAEGPCFGDTSGSWDRSVEYTAKFIEHVARIGNATGTAERHPAQQMGLPDDCLAAVITDPPYYNAVPYADLSDFFQIWFNKNLSGEFPELFSRPTTEKEKELCEMAGWDSVRYSHKDALFYEDGMAEAFNEARRCCSPNGIAVVVFAHKTAAGWETLLSALVKSGWIVTGSWPIDTERAGRLRAMDSAALASSVHLVCRPRETSDGKVRTDDVGDWRDVLQELPQRIHDWMPRLAAEGVVGADAIFACLGPALEIYSRYSRVEKASGEQVTLREYLEHIWAAVSKEALSSLITDTDLSSLEADARITAMWLWTLTGGQASREDAEADSDNAAEDEEEGSAKPSGKGGFGLEYDAARKIAQGLGAALEDLKAVVEIKGDKARLLPVAERTAYLFGKDQSSTPDAPTKGKKKKAAQMDLFAELTGGDTIEAEAVWEEKTVSKPGATVLDRVHQAMILFATGRGEALKRFLVEDGIGGEGNFWKLAQALSALYPSGSQEKRWVDGVLARKKGLGL